MKYETEIPSQQAPPVARPYIARQQADVLQLGRLGRSPIVPERSREECYRHIVRPGSVAMTDYGAAIVTANSPQLAIVSNDRRKRFVIVNPDTAVSTLYFSFGATAFSWIPIAPGGVWDESGSEISPADIFVKSATAGATFGAYEGVPLEMRKDEFRR